MEKGEHRHYYSGRGKRGQSALRLWQRLARSKNNSGSIYRQNSQELMTHLKAQCYKRRNKYKTLFSGLDIEWLMESFPGVLFTEQKLLTKMILFSAYCTSFLPKKNQILFRQSSVRRKTRSGLHKLIVIPHGETLQVVNNHFEQKISGVKLWQPRIRHKATTGRA